MTETSSVDWMLDELIAEVDALQAVALSTDGIIIQTSSRIDRDDADQVAAMASSLAGISQGVARHCHGGPVQQTIVEMADKYLLVTAAGPNALLALLAGKDVDLGLVGYEMNRLATRVGEHLTSAQRTHPVLRS